MNFILALGWMQLAIYTVIFLFILFDIASDREGRKSNKWFLFMGFTVLYVGFNFNDISWSTTASTLFTKDTLLHVLTYLCIGVVYSVIEFRNVVKESADLFLKYAKNPSNRDSVKLLRFSHLFMVVSQVADEKPTPFINKSSLVDNITVWTLFWPLYAINMIIGKFLNNIFEIISEFIIANTKNFVAKTFNKAFEIK